MTTTADSQKNENDENYGSGNTAPDNFYESNAGSSDLNRKTVTVPPQTIVSSFVKSASQLRGLAFGNKIDELLGGLAPNTFTFVYGPGTERMMNILCGNAIQIFGGQAVFIDAANSFDPYTIVKECTGPKSSEASEKLLQSIIISRAFTCYQLTDLVVKQLIDLIEAKNNPRNSMTNNADNRIKFVCVSGVSSVFNEQDNSKAETERLQCLMAASLQKIASDRQSGVQFIVSSSKDRCNYFVSKSDIAIKVYSNKKTGEEKAKLVKHYSRQFSEINL